MSGIAVASLFIYFSLRYAETNKASAAEEKIEIEAALPTAEEQMPADAKMEALLTNEKRRFITSSQCDVNDSLFLRLLCQEPVMFLFVVVARMQSKVILCNAMYALCGSK